MKCIILSVWNFIFNSDVNSLRHIPDVATKHYVLQDLGLMWAVSFAVAIGSYTMLAVSVIGHTVLIGAAAITAATYTAAANKPSLFTNGSSNSDEGDKQ